MKKVILIRHGQSTYNETQRFAGWSDCPLTPKGVEQARNLAERLDDKAAIQAIISSDLTRAYDTAMALSQVTGLKIVKDQGLREVHLGDWEGLTMQAIETDFKEEVSSWFDDHFSFTYPRGENLEGAVLRAHASVMNHLHQVDHLAVVAHAGIISGLISYWLMGSIKHADQFRIENATYQVLYLNDQDHQPDIGQEWDVQLNYLAKLNG